jgi:hypothetical protein
MAMLDSPTKQAPGKTGRLASYRIYLIMLLCYIGGTVAYREVFRPDPTRPNVARVGSTLFSRTYLIDSSLYEQAYNDPDFKLEDIAASVDGDDTRFNAIGISALGWQLREASIEPIYPNMILVALAGLLLLAVCTHYQASPSGPLMLLFLNPSTIYYSQTTTKEILTAFATALFAYSIVKGTRTWRGLGVLVALLVTGLFRAQTALPMLFTVLFLTVSSVNRRRGFLAAFVGISLVLPYLYSRGIIDTFALELYHADVPSVTSLARYVDSGIQKVPLAGLLFLPIRMFQNATEPFPALQFQESDLGTNAISVYAVILGISVVLSWFFTCELGRILWRWLAQRQSGPRHLELLVLYATMYWLMVATNPFVHTRYLYAVLPIFALRASLNRASLNAMDSAAMSRVKLISGGWSTTPSWACWGVLMVVSSAIIFFRP